MENAMEKQSRIGSLTGEVALIRAQMYGFALDVDPSESSAGTAAKYGGSGMV